jgi:hypothetical protein
MALALEAPKETPKKQQLMMPLNSYARERGLSFNTTPTNNHSPINVSGAAAASGFISTHYHT